MADAAQPEQVVEEQLALSWRAERQHSECGAALGRCAQSGAQGVDPVPGVGQERHSGGEEPALGLHDGRPERLVGRLLVHPHFLPA